MGFIKLNAHDQLKDIVSPDMHEIYRAHVHSMVGRLTSQRETVQASAFINNDGLLQLGVANNSDANLMVTIELSNMLVAQSDTTNYFYPIVDMLIHKQNSNGTRIHDYRVYFTSILLDYLSSKYSQDSSIGQQVNGISLRYLFANNEFPDKNFYKIWENNGRHLIRRGPDIIACWPDESGQILGREVAEEVSKYNKWASVFA